MTCHPAHSLKPNTLPTLLTNNAWLVEVIVRLTNRPVEEVGQALYDEEQQIGSNVIAAMNRRGIPPHTSSTTC